MKKFGLEFVLENKSKQAFAQIMDQQRRLEKQLNNNIKAFNKFQSAVNNTSLDSSITSSILFFKVCFLFILFFFL